MRKFGGKPAGANKKRARSILIFIGSLTGGGAERVAVALSGFLVHRGYTVKLVTLHQADTDFYSLPRGVGRVSLGFAGDTRGLEKIWANWRRLRALRAVIRNEAPDTVIGMMTTQAVLSILAGMGLSSRIVVSERNYPGHRSVARPWSLLRRILYRFADAHVAQTEEIATWLRKHTGARKIHVIPNSVRWPVPRCPPEVAPGSILDPAHRVVLAVGTKPYQKGFDLLLKAFSNVTRDRPQWRLVILGVERERAGLGNAPHSDPSAEDPESIVLPGRVGNVADWYARADAFVLSSRYEGFPNVLLEAMAAGCACIAFDCESGPRDIISHGVDGLLVPSDDVGLLGEAMRQVMDSPELRARLGQRALQVRTRFSEERVLAKWLDVLQ